MGITFGILIGEKYDFFKDNNVETTTVPIITQEKPNLQFIIAEYRITANAVKQIEDLYQEVFPNEMAACSSYMLKDDVMTIWNVSKSDVIDFQTKTNVSYYCSPNFYFRKFF